ncbi:Hypothetical predicted protein, partial [Paramuricea clavata]
CCHELLYNLNRTKRPKWGRYSLANLLLKNTLENNARIKIINNEIAFIGFTLHEIKHEGSMMS